MAGQIVVTTWAVGFLLLLLHISAFRPEIFIGFFFIIFTLAWRTLATAYIDLVGPVYASQLYRYVGPGSATVIHVLAYLTTLLPFLLLLRPSLMHQWNDQADCEPAPPGYITLADVTFVLSLVFFLWLFVDLISGGVIPLFSRMERFDFTAQYAGSPHRWLVRYGNFLAFWWGMMFAIDRLRTRRLDLRFLGLLGVLLVYMFLTGNRFSAFYSFGSFFVMPLVAPVIFETKPSRYSRPFGWVGGTFKLGDVLAIGVVVVLAGMVTLFGLYNNLINVRGYADSEAIMQFLERLLVQPSELGWVSYERVFLRGEWDPDRVADFLFSAPIDPSRNTTPQYLMLTTIGEPRTYEHISRGFQFAGGFPEIFFELFGPVLSWPFLFGAGWISAGLTALIIRGTLQGNPASAFLSLYVLYGFYVMYIGGMLSFAMTPSYWIKVGALAIAVVVERSLELEKLKLLPWALFPIPQERVVHWIRMGRKAELSVRQSAVNADYPPAARRSDSARRPL